MKKLLYISIPLLLVALVMLYFQVVRGASEAKYAGASTVDTSFGTTNWTSPGNITSSDNVYALVTSNGRYTYYLISTSHGFSIPEGATIDGIVASIERNSSNGGSTAKDARVRIVKSGSIGTTDKANTTDFWPGDTDATATYGSSSDLWGETWTASNINASNFGVALSVECFVGSYLCGDNVTWPLVDSIQITVYYTEASTNTATFQVRGGQMNIRGGSVKIGDN